MKRRPYAFLRLQDRWINMCMVTDIEDRGSELRLFMSADMARLTGGADPQPLDVARRFDVSEPEAMARLKQWLMLNDED